MARHCLLMATKWVVLGAEKTQLCNYFFYLFSFTGARSRVDPS